MVYFALSLLILVALAFLIAGIGVVVYARRFEQWYYEKLTMPLARRFVKFFGITLEEWTRKVAKLPSLSFRLWLTRIWGGMLVALSAVALSAIIAALFRI